MKKILLEVWSEVNVDTETLMELNFFSEGSGNAAVLGPTLWKYNFPYVLLYENKMKMNWAQLDNLPYDAFWQTWLL